MPSASTKPDNRCSSEAIDLYKQVMQVMDKKVKSLAKRKIRLDHHREKNDSGAKLNTDQKEAVMKYDSVVAHLELARELQKQFVTIQTENEPLMKRLAKREKLDNYNAEVRRIKELLQLQELLQNLKTDSVREDFKNGRNGAIQLSDTHLEQLDQLYKLVSPSRHGEKSYAKELNTASEHLVLLLHGRDRPVIGTTYKELKALVLEINECHYFDTKEEKAKNTDIDEEKKDVGTEKEDQSEDTERAQLGTLGDQDQIDESVPAATLHEGQHTTKLPQLTPGITPVSVLEAETTASPSQLPPQTQIETQTLAAVAHQHQQRTTVTNPTASSLEANTECLSGLANAFPEQDDSFFTTTTGLTGQRAFTDIVSSVQGTFNFLQDSHIEAQNSPHLDPAVVAAQPMTTPSISQTAPSGGGYHSSSLLSSSTDRNSLAQSQLTSQSDSTAQQTQQQPTQLESTFSAGLDFSQQSQMSNLQNAHTTYGSDTTSDITSGHQMSTLDQAVPGISATPDAPPSIPLPNQTSMTGNTNMSDSQANISQESQEKKHYSMNPNAVTFQSMYSQPQGNVQQQNNDYSQQQQSHTTSSVDSSSKYNTEYQGSNNFENSNYSQSQQGGGGYGNNYNSRGSWRGGSGPRNSSGRGGGRGGGSSGMSNMSNGYSQRPSGRSNGPFSSNRGGYNGNRGSSRGMRGGGPRGSVRGGSSSRGTYGGQRSGSQQ